MAIIQISKIQHRTGNIDDLPQLSVGELGWATDAKRLFIGNDPNVLGPTPDNTEILTQWSEISAAGSNTQVQFNQAGTFGASSAFAFDYGTNTLTLEGDFLPQMSGVYDLGSANLAWGNLYLSGNSLYLDNQHIYVANDSLTTSNVYVTDTFTANNIVTTNVSASGNISVSLNGILGGNLVVGGNLDITGNINYYDITNLRVSDPLIELGGGPNGAPLTSNDGKDRGVILKYYTSAPVSAFMGWDNSNAEFTFSSNATFSNDVASYNTLGNVRAANFIGNLVGTLVAPGSNTQVLFNDAGTINGSSNLQLNGSTLIVAGNVTPGGIKTDNYYYANGVAISFAGSYSNSNVSNYLPTYTGNLSGGNANITSNIATGGIKTDNYYYANGVAISFAGSYSNSNVGSYLPTYYGTVGSNNITTGADTTAGNITGNWTLTGNSQMNATYADLAEYYLADQKYDSGTVLAFGGRKEVTVSTAKNYQKIAGVVTTNPAYVMNIGLEKKGVCIALIGRVPVKVVGKIEKGDLLRASPEHDGIAVSTGDGGIIGRAIQRYNSEEVGLIEVMVGRT